MNLADKVKEYREKWKGKFLPFFIGAFTFFVILSLEHAFDDFSRTEAFCTSCHSMGLMGKEYRESIHFSSRSGVRARCGDCHVSQGTLSALYEHVSAAGMVLSEIVHDFKDPILTEKTRPQMAFKARRWFEKTGSATCKKCHVLDAILGSRMGVGAVHSDKSIVGEGNCVTCHINLVHRHVPGEKVFKQEAWDRMIDEQFGIVSEGEKPVESVAVEAPVTSEQEVEAAPSE